MNLKVWAAVQAAFLNVPRPEIFIRETCQCCECREHNDTLASNTPDKITLNELGNAGWDPICFANDAAFLYYLPAMMRLSLTTNVYVDQLLFHLSQPGRLDSLDPHQILALYDALWYLSEIKEDLIAHVQGEYRMEEVLKKLESKGAGNG